MSLYDDLGVGKQATKEQIKRAYRKMAKRHHPDSNGGNGSAEEFHAIALAYEVLSDPKRRARYDATGNTQDGPKGSIEEKARQRLVSIFMQSVQESLVQFVQNDGIKDLLVVTKIKLENQVKATEAKQKELEHIDDYLAELLDRLGGDGDAGLLRASLMSEQAKVLLDKDIAREELELLEKCFSLLKTYSFRPDEEARVSGTINLNAIFNDQWTTTSF